MDKTKKFISPGDLTGNWENFFSLFFHWIDGRLVKENHLYNSKREQEYAKKKNWLSLADLYLFDEKKENDNKIAGLLKKNLKNKIPLDDKILSNLTLSEFYLMNQKTDLAIEHLNLSSEIIQKNKSEKKLEKVLFVVADELEIISNLLKTK